MQNKKLSKSDYIIKLNEIPHQGETYEFSKETKDISSFFNDLTGDGDYQIRLHIVPMGNVYQVSGYIKSSLILDCSRCGQDSTEVCDESVNEILMVQPKSTPRTAKEGRSHETEHNEGPFCNFLDKPQLHVAEFAREIIASSIPYLSYCGRSNCQSTLEQATAADFSPESEKLSPFAQLADLKEKLRPQ